MLYEVITVGGTASDQAFSFREDLTVARGDVQSLKTAATRNSVVATANNRITSYNVCYTKLLRTHHINLADWADAVIVAPATANIIGKAANGIADDFVSTTLLAMHCPIIFAPAMNDNMWNNPAVQRNITVLEKSYNFV